MTLGEKLRHLRSVEGAMRGLDRAMTQQEVARTIKQELGGSLTQSYLSQIESGARPHLTNASRALLARFFRVHPGHLVDDPDGFHTELSSHLRTRATRLGRWLSDGAERFDHDRELSGAMRRLAHDRDARRHFLLLGAILETPGLAERLIEVLTPTDNEAATGPRRRNGNSS